MYLEYSTNVISLCCDKLGISFWKYNEVCPESTQPCDMKISDIY